MTGPWRPVSVVPGGHRRDGRCPLSAEILIFRRVPPEQRGVRYPTVGPLARAPHLGRGSLGREGHILSPVEATDHPNAVAYRRTADAFRSADTASLASLIDPAVVWHVPGTHAMAGDVRGRDALLKWLVQLKRKGFWLTEHDVLGNDRHVCALSIMGARREGVDVQTRVVSVFHYRNGHQVERWFYPEDPVAWDRIFRD